VKDRSGTSSNLFMKPSLIVLIYYYIQPLMHKE